MSLFRTLKCLMSAFRISYFPHCFLMDVTAQNDEP